MLSSNYSCEGQLSIFDLTSSQSILPDLTKGEKFYGRKGIEVVEYTVTGKQWNSSNGNRTYYEVESPDGDHTSITHDQIDTAVFRDKSKVQKLADDFLKSHDVILAEDIHPVETHAYSVVRSVDGRVLYAYYCLLDNGMVYMKNFMTYDHIFTQEHAKKAIKGFSKQQFFDLDKVVEEKDFVPQFKNMYKTTEGCNWDYTQIECSYACGSTAYEL